MEALKEQYSIDSKTKSICLGAIGLGVLGLVISFFQSPYQGWVNVLLNNFYLIGLCLSAAFLLALQPVAGAAWLSPYKRIPEAMAKFIPIAFVLMLALFFGIHSLYEWSHPEIMKTDALLQKKVAFLNTPGFMIRMVLIFVLWIAGVNWMLALSKKQEEGTSEALRAKIAKSSAIFLIIFALSFCLASFDWIMSLEPHWFSTIFGIYCFAGAFVSGLCLITLSILFLKKRGYLSYVNENHLHDLGKFIFGFSTFWAYIWLSQYLLIWYSNIPEETEYFILRSHDGWGALFWVNLVINWAIPFLVLMPRASKRCPKILATVCGVLLVGHWLDLYVMIGPKVFAHAKMAGPHIGIAEPLVWIGFMGLFVFATATFLGKRSLTPNEDPFFEEGSHLHQ